ncbi:hypothetical protein V4C53_02325 [Paraburkholderia azotifigens]|uniref:hypothetical protein n=1 Tax=Paraburkholderia azotifigens TaxID=2057004 RepID=UPI00317CF79F
MREHANHNLHRHQHRIESDADVSAFARNALLFVGLGGQVGRHLKGNGFVAINSTRRFMNPLLSDRKKSFKSCGYHNAKHSHQSSDGAVAAPREELKSKGNNKKPRPSMQRGFFNALLAMQALSQIISR